MKTTTIAFTLALTTATAFANNHQKVLKQVDALVAGDTYEAAFKCGDTSTDLEEVCWGNECQTNYSYSEVTTCGKITTITSTGQSDDDEAFAFKLNKSVYKQYKGNPLRIFEANDQLVGSGLEWKSAKAIKVNHLGTSRNALKVTGLIEVCFEEGEVRPSQNKTENCVKGPVEVVVVQGVPFLANIASLAFNIDGFNLKQNLIEFSRKE